MSLSVLTALTGAALATTTTTDLVLPPWEGCRPVTVTVSSAYSPLTVPTAARPQSATLGAAVRYGTSVNACKLVLLVQSGTYPEDVRFDRQTDLLGRGATNPVVRGRLDGSDQAVSLNHVTVTGSRGDALVQRGGRLVLNDVAVTDASLSRESGWGLRASAGAQVDAWDLDLIRNVGGLRAEGRGTVVRVTDGWIVGNGALGTFTAGVDATDGAVVALDGSTVDGNFHRGVTATGGARVDLVATDVTDTAVDAGMSGVNVWLDSGAEVTGDDVLLSGGEIGFVHGDGYLHLAGGLITANTIGLHPLVPDVNHTCFTDSLLTGNNVDQDFSSIGLPTLDLECLKGGCEADASTRRCAEVPVR